MTEQTYEDCEIPVYSAKDLQKFKDVQARLLFNLCQAFPRSLEHLKG